MPKFPKPDLEQYLRTYVIGPFAVSKDERRLAYSTNMAGQFDVWGMNLPGVGRGADSDAGGGASVGVAGPIGAPFQLTFQGQTCGDLRFGPKDRYLLALFDQDGNELTQIFALPGDGGVPHRIIGG